METYEQRYKEALERARIWKEKSGMPKDKQGILDDIFPELNEKIEDERIRNEIIDYLKSFIPHHDCNLVAKSKGWITWLEKQGEQKSIWSEENNCYYDDICEILINLINSPKSNVNKDAVQKDLNWLMSIKELQSKPTRSEEPKFKVGDWCIDNEDNTIFQITKVLSNLYYYKTNEGKEYSCTRDSIERDAHLWTSKDAKDGDVLVAKIDEEPNDFIYIFYEYNQNLGFWSHCYLDAYINKFHKGIYHNNYNVGFPATKEQRDLLFQKMEKAGYKWDTEKKELKRIEQNHAYNWNELTWEDIVTLEGIINNVHYEFRNGIGQESFGKEVLERFRETNGDEYMDSCGQNPAWSEEDEEMIDAVIGDIQFTQKAHNHEVNQVVYERKIDWLKSLKQRLNGTE